MVLGNQPSTTSVYHLARERTGVEFIEAVTYEPFQRPCEQRLRERRADFGNFAVAQEDACAPRILFVHRRVHLQERVQTRRDGDSFA